MIACTAESDEATLTVKDTGLVQKRLLRVQMKAMNWDSGRLYFREERIHFSVMMF
jgi:hypothetical protein